MSILKELNELKAEKARLAEEAQGHLSNKDMTKLKAANDKIEVLNGNIIEIERTLQLSAENSTPVKEPDKKAEKPFNSLGEQLQSIYNAKQNGIVDKRLEIVNAAAKGASSGIGADGGFAVQEDFVENILSTAAESGEILRRVDSYTASANSDTVRWVEIDEQDITTTVYGGVQTYWVAEAGDLTASKPKFLQRTLTLEKIGGLAYATSEILEDASFMSGFFGKAFTLATERLLEDSIIRGDGIGKPAGILGSDSLVTVATEAGQTAGSLNAKNILKMWSRSLTKNRSNSIWLMHPDLEEQLPELVLNDEPVWMPAGGISGKQYQTIFGRPVIFNDQCSEIGKKGDIILSDLSEYILIRKGSARQDWSMHVQFITDQMAFRIILRVNGMPKHSKPIKLKNSKIERSAFVTLGDRA